MITKVEILYNNKTVIVRNSGCSEDRKNVGRTTDNLSPTNGVSGPINEDGTLYNP